MWTVENEVIQVWNNMSSKCSFLVHYPFKWANTFWYLCNSIALVCRLSHGCYKHQFWFGCGFCVVSAHRCTPRLLSLSPHYPPMFPLWGEGQPCPDVRICGTFFSKRGSGGGGVQIPLKGQMCDTTDMPHPTLLASQKPCWLVAVILRFYGSDWLAMLLGIAVQTGFTLNVLVMWL